mgnify:CR=1 FL=1
MMALRHWIDDLQSQLVLNPATGFIASLNLFLKAPAAAEGEERKNDFYTEFGIQIREKIQSVFLSGKILRKLH